MKEKKFHKELADSDISMEELGDYLYAKHAPERDAKIKEEKPDLDKEQKRRLMKDVVIYSKLKGTYVPIETKFERFINKPFDKPHSFSYIFNIQQPAVTKATFEKAEIGAYALSDLTKNTTGY